MATTTPTRRDAARAALAAVCPEVVDGTDADAVDGVPAALVARAGSTAQVGELLRAAAAHDLVVVPRGRGTKTTWGRPPDQVDLVVDLSPMGAVLDHAAGDLIVEVQAGALLADVQATVQSAGQRLALDEPVPGASIGGTLATNTSGPGRVAVGTARDLLIGCTVVRADGTVTKAGGRVVKNVAGYDLGKLVIGSFGTLGIVTEAVFRLHPVPAARGWVTVGVDSPAQAQAAVQRVLHDQLVPAAVEVDWPGQGGGGAVQVLLEGTEGGVAERAAALVGVLGQGAEHAAEPPAGWGRLPWHDEPGDDRATALKLTFALSALETVLAAADTAATTAGARLALRGSAGAGVLHAALPAGTDVGAVASVVDALRPVCTAAGGALVVLDGSPEVKAGVDTWGPIPALDLMRRVKDRFDPDRRLAPGRFVGGI